MSNHNENKRKAIINVHCHLLNLKFIPEKMVKLLSRMPESIADDKWLEVAIGTLYHILGVKRLARIKRFLKIFRQKEISRVTKIYMKEMKNAGIDICVPLMMDLFKAAPNPRDINIPYDRQIDLISEQVWKNPWRIFPFVMFDPRRDNSVGLCKDAIENKGFIGVKIYPALGYHPSTFHIKDGTIDIKKEGMIKENLEALYRYCGENEIPITTHASVGGAYSTEVDKNREKYAWPLTEVSNWIGIINKYNLKINFAHLGGNYFHEDGDKRLQSATWRREILNLIELSNLKNDFGSVYSDLSFHDMALDRKLKKGYFRDLREILNNDHTGSNILFGTDASMISHSWLEREYIKPFRDKRYLKSEFQDKIFTQNPVRFLFGDEGRIPDSYIEFLGNNVVHKDAFLFPEDWVEKRDDDNYYIIF